MECDNWHLSKLLLGISLLFLWILLLVRNYALLIIVLAALSCEAVPIVCVRQSSFRLGKTVADYDQDLPTDRGYCLWSNVAVYPTCSVPVSCATLGVGGVSDGAIPYRSTDPARTCHSRKQGPMRGPRNFRTWANRVGQNFPRSTRT